MELIPTEAIGMELLRQGFWITFDENHEGRRWMLAWQGDRLITVFDVDRPTWRQRMNALARCREAGFLWPD